MILFTLAWRNLWRHPKRTALTAAAIGLAVGVLTFFFSLQLKSYDAAINASVGVFHGHLQIQRVGYLDTPEMRKFIKQVDSILEKLKSILSEANISKRALGYGLLSSDTRSYGAQVVGVEPELEPKVSNIPGLIKHGRYLLNSDEYTAVVGNVLARNLQVQVGEEITLMSQGADGSLVATSLNVVGIFESGSVDIDRGMVQLPLNIFQELFGIEKGAHVVVARLENRDQLVAAESKIQSLLKDIDGDLVALNWEKLMPGLKESIDLDMSAGWLFYISLIGIVSFTILNTFLMSVLERSREFGTVLSLGASPGSLCRLVIIEGILLIILGLIVGIILGAIVVGYFNIYGFTAPGAEEVLKKWNLPARIYPEITFESFSSPTLTVALSSLLAVIYPALKVLRLDALTAMRGVH